MLTFSSLVNDVLKILVAILLAVRLTLASGSSLLSRLLGPAHLLFGGGVCLGIWLESGLFSGLVPHRVGADLDLHRIPPDDGVPNLEGEEHLKAPPLQLVAGGVAEELEVLGRPPAGEREGQRVAGVGAAGLVHLQAAILVLGAEDVVGLVRDLVDGAHPDVQVAVLALHKDRGGPDDGARGQGGHLLVLELEHDREDMVDVDKELVHQRGIVAVLLALLHGLVKGQGKVHLAKVGVGGVGLRGGPRRGERRHGLERVRVLPPQLP